MTVENSPIVVPVLHVIHGGEPVHVSLHVGHPGVGGVPVETVELLLSLLVVELVTIRQTSGSEDVIFLMFQGSQGRVK